MAAIAAEDISVDAAAAAIDDDDDDFALVNSDCGSSNVIQICTDLNMIVTQSDKAYTL